SNNSLSGALESLLARVYDELLARACRTRSRLHRAHHALRRQRTGLVDVAEHVAAPGVAVLPVWRLLDDRVPGAVPRRLVLVTVGRDRRRHQLRGDDR